MGHLRLVAEHAKVLLVGTMGQLVMLASRQALAKARAQLRPVLVLVSQAVQPQERHTRAVICLTLAKEVRQAVQARERHTQAFMAQVHLALAREVRQAQAAQPLERHTWAFMAQVRLALARVVRQALQQLQRFASLAVGERQMASTILVAKLVKPPTGVAMDRLAKTAMLVRKSQISSEVGSLHRK